MKSTATGMLVGRVTPEHIAALKNGQQVVAPGFTISQYTSPSGNTTSGNWIINFNPPFATVPAFVANAVSSTGWNYLINVRSDQPLSTSQVCIQIAGLRNENAPDAIGFSFIAMAGSDANPA